MGFLGKWAVKFALKEEVLLEVGKHHVAHWKAHIPKRDYEAVYDKLYENFKSVPTMPASKRIHICRDMAIETLDCLLER